MKTTRSRVGSLSVAVTKSSLQKDIRIGSPDVFSAKIEEEEDFDTNLLFYFESGACSSWCIEGTGHASRRSCCLLRLGAHPTEGAPAGRALARLHCGGGRYKS